MITLSDIPSRAGAWLTPQIVVFAAILATAPLWLGAIGLYQYLGIEIAIWMIYALGFNLLFGYGGLHSFGHGAYLGIGAYAFGFFQHHVGVSLWGGLLAAMLASGIAGALVGAAVSHRRGIYFALLTIAYGQVFWFSAIKLHRLTGGEDGLLNIPTADARSRLRQRRSQRQHGALLFRRGGARGRRNRPLAHRELALRPHPPGRAPERKPHRLRRLRGVVVQVGGLRHLYALRGLRWRALRHGAGKRLPRHHEPASVRPHRDDGAGRRRTRRASGARSTASCSTSSRATCSARSPRLGSCGTA